MENGPASETICEQSERSKGCPFTVVCRCLRITEQTVVEAVDRFGLEDPRQVMRHTGAGGGCTACRHNIKQIIEQVTYSSSSPICSLK